MIPRFSISVRFRDRSIPVDTLPPGLWAQALHDYQSPERWDPALGRFVPKPREAAYYREDLGYPVPRSLYRVKDKLKDWKGFPQMVPGNPRIGVRLTKNIQWFWFKLLVYEYTGILLVENETQTFEAHYKRLLREGRITRIQDEFLKNAWRGLTKSFTAFTNQRGTDNCMDYIREQENGDEDPMLWENTTGGALLRLESLRVYREGYRILALKTSDFKLWKNWTPYSHPGYFTDSTNSLPLGFDGEPTLRGPWKVDRFHYLGNSRAVWVPIMSNNGYFHLKTNRVRILRQGEKFPPKATNP